MPIKPPTLRPLRCPAPKLKHDNARQKHEERRGNAHKRGYNVRWQKARNTFLAREPLCRICKREGQIVAATVVDHWFPHKGDSKVFWNTKHWVALCKPCHDGPKQSLERRGHAALEQAFEMLKDAAAQ